MDHVYIKPERRGAYEVGRASTSSVLPLRRATTILVDENQSVNDGDLVILVQVGDGDPTVWVFKAAAPAEPVLRDESSF